MEELTKRSANKSNQNREILSKQQGNFNPEFFFAVHLPGVPNPAIV